MPAKPSRPNEENDWLQGYCYQFWRSTHHAFRGDGAFGQFTLVLPEEDAVIAITSESANMQGELDLVWEHLLPALKRGPMAPDGPAESRLRQTLASLALTPPKGLRSSPLAATVGDRTFAFDKNDLGFRSGTVSFGTTCRLTLRDENDAYPILCGMEKWHFGETALPGTPPNLVPIPPKPGAKSKIAASGTWKDENTFEVMVRYYETPHHDTITCHFEGSKVQVRFMSSLAAQSANPQDKRPVLDGKLGPGGPVIKGKRKKKGH